MTNAPNQSTSGTNQDKTALQPNQAQPGQPGQQDQGGKPLDQHQQSGGQQRPGEQGKPSGIDQGASPAQQSGGSKS